MIITVSIKEDLHKKIKHVAVDENSTVSAIISKLLTEYIANKSKLSEV